MIIPDLSEEQLGTISSPAEVKLYRAMRSALPSDYLVLFQVGWILKQGDDNARDGETDFIICHPNHGYVCIEVKGGGIGYDASSGEWYSIDRGGRRHDIKNPCRQAMKAKYSIRAKLNENGRWQALGVDRVAAGHAVFFPDINGPERLARPDLPTALIGSAKDLNDIRSWVEKVLSYWDSKDEPQRALGRDGVNVIRDAFARTVEVSPLVSSRLADQELKRLVLTTDQLKVLDFIRSHRRVAVSGGAGTGKTILALEKARRLASEGFRTLLTCYNRQLADHLAEACKSNQNLDVMSFHQLCYRQSERASRSTGRDLLDEARSTYPGKGLYDVHLPNALLYALEILPDRYDAIVCDEGQDFPDEFWAPLELLLTDYDSCPFYVFFDDNQNLYARTGSFPIKGEPFCLSSNCRNTKQIHHAAYHYYKGPQVEPPRIEGDKIHFECIDGRNQQLARIGSRVVELIAQQGVAPGDIAILIVDALRKAECYAELKRFALPKPASWLEEGRQSSNTVLMDTVQRFKGLESPVVILWGLDSLDVERHQELLYVGMSRAKSLLFVFCSKNIRSEIGGQA